MDIVAAASMQIQAMALANARTAVQHVQASPVPADASAAQRADVILQLSAAAQSLLK